MSVYNVYCKQFTYFSTNYAPVMPPHSVSRPLHRGNLISVSLNKRTLVSPPYCEREPVRGVGDVIPRALRRRYIFLNRKAPSTCSVCATFRIYTRLSMATQNCSTLPNTPDTRELAVERRRRCVRFAARPVGTTPSLRARLRNIDLFSLRFPSIPHWNGHRAYARRRML